METISWTDCVRNEEVLRRVKESKIEWTAKWGTQRKQVIDDLKEMIKYWKLKQKAIDSISDKSPLEEARDLS
jgi:ABC-type Mn2+/Zn2+ transport system ATPase subunit